MPRCDWECDCGHIQTDVEYKITAKPKFISCTGCDGVAKALPPGSVGSIFPQGRCKGTQYFRPGFGPVPGS